MSSWFFVSLIDVLCIIQLTIDRHTVLMASCWTRPHRRASVCIELLFLHPGPWGQIGLHAGARSYECCVAPLKLGLFGPLALYVCAWLSGPKLQPSDSHLLSSHFLLHLSAIIFSTPFFRVRFAETLLWNWNPRRPSYHQQQQDKWPPDSGKQHQIILAKQSSFKSHWAQPWANSGHWQKASEATKRPWHIIFCQSSTSWNRCVTLSAQRFGLGGVEHLSSPVPLVTWCLWRKIYHSNWQPPLSQWIRRRQDSMNWWAKVGSAQKVGQAFLPGVHNDGLATQTLAVQSRDGLESKLDGWTSWSPENDGQKHAKTYKNCWS